MGDADVAIYAACAGLALVSVLVVACVACYVKRKRSYESVPSDANESI